MRASLRSILAGAATIIAITAAAPAMARDDQIHILAVQLPGGEIKRIQYTGDIAPTVIFAPTPMVEPEFAPEAAFATLERISAALDRQAEIMLRQAADVPAFLNTRLISMPPHAAGYSVMSTWSNNGTCVRSTQVTYISNSAQPRVVSRSFGQCGPNQSTTVPEQIKLPEHHQPTSIPDTIWARASGKTRYSGMVWPAVWQREKAAS